MELSLYTIEKEYLDLAQRIMDAEGESTPEIEQALQINKQQLETKSAGYGFVVKEAEAQIKSIDAEIERLTALKASRTNLIDKLKTAVKNAMELHKYDKIESSTLTLTLTKSTETIIDDPDSVPMKYKTKKITYAISKAAIKNDLNAGKKVKGAHLLNKKNLQIK